MRTNGEAANQETEALEARRNHLGDLILAYAEQTAINHCEGDSPEAEGARTILDAIAELRAIFEETRGS